MKILYVSTLCTPQVLDEIFASATVKPGQAVQKFHRLLVEGFCKHPKLCSVDVLSAIPVTTKSHSQKWWKKRNESYKGAAFQYLPFLNYSYFKHVFVFLITFYKVVLWRLRDRKEKKIVICDILNNGIAWSTFIACKLTGQKIAVIVTDLPSMIITNNASDKLTFHEKLLLKLSNLVLQSFDYYIILTEAMNKLVNPYTKPNIVIEGLVDCEISYEINDEIAKSKKRVVLYAGGIYEKYGVRNLLEAFSLLKDENLELHIFGSGDLDQEMHLYSKRDYRIKYFGVVGNTVIVEKLKSATLLINPRPTNEEFTKYSFPSKNMEFMVSATPLLTTKLPGMPEEYNKYVYLFDDETVLGMSKTLENLLYKSDEEIRSFGKKAQHFVLECKSNKIQAKRIINFLKI